MHSLVSSRAFLTAAATLSCVYCITISLLTLSRQQLLVKPLLLASQSINSKQSVVSIYYSRYNWSIENSISFCHTTIRSNTYSNCILVNYIPHSMNCNISFIYFFYSTFINFSNEYRLVPFQLQTQ